METFGTIFSLPIKFNIYQNAAKRLYSLFSFAETGMRRSRFFLANKPHPFDVIALGSNLLLHGLEQITRWDTS